MRGTRHVSLTAFTAICSHVLVFFPPLSITRRVVTLQALISQVETVTKALTGSGGGALVDLSEALRSLHSVHIVEYGRCLSTDLCFKPPTVTVGK